MSWRQSGESRWVARDSDGYSLRVRAHGDQFRWSLHPPGGGYAVSHGESQSQPEALVAVEHAYVTLMQKIKAAHEERLLRLRRDRHR